MIKRTNIVCNQIESINCGSSWKFRLGTNNCFTPVILFILRSLKAFHFQQKVECSSWSFLCAFQTLQHLWVLELADGSGHADYQQCLQWLGPLCSSFYVCPAWLFNCWASAVRRTAWRLQQFWEFYAVLVFLPHCVRSSVLFHAHQREVAMGISFLLLVMALPCFLRSGED